MSIGEVVYYRFSVGTDDLLMYRIVDVPDKKHIRVEGINTKFMNGIRPIEAFVTREKAKELVNNVKSWKEYESKNFKKERKRKIV